MLVHLGRSDAVAELDGTGTAGVDVVGTRALLDAAGSVGVDHVVLLSSATVYGAWANNPVPLTEDAPLRPNPGWPTPSHKAEVERLAAEWRDAPPRATVAVLRPTVAVAEDTTDWLAASLWAGTVASPAGDDDPPAQFVHLDDLAAAVDLARRERLDGPVNVAPDGWMRGDELRAPRRSRPPRSACPSGVAHRLAQLALALGLASTPPGAAAVQGQPVGGRQRPPAGRRAGRPTTPTRRPTSPGTARTVGHPVSPRRRQELALGGLAVGASVRRRRRARGPAAAPPPLTPGARGASAPRRQSGAARLAETSRTSGGRRRGGSRCGRSSPGSCRREGGDQVAHRRDLGVADLGDHVGVVEAGLGRRAVLGHAVQLGAAPHAAVGGVRRRPGPGPRCRATRGRGRRWR